jgi:preprotein translocase subunit SecF
MEFFRIKRDLPLMRHALVFNVISFLTFAAAVFFLVTRGLHFSIEFTGGTVMEVQYAQTADPEAVRSHTWSRWASASSRCRSSAPAAT